MELGEEGFGGDGGDGRVGEIFDVAGDDVVEMMAVGGLGQDTIFKIWPLSSNGS